MRVLIVGIVVLALAVAGVSTYLIKSFSSEEAIQELEQEAAPVKFRILVAARPLQPGDKLIPDAMTWLAWPEESVRPEYLAIEREDQQDAKREEVQDSYVRQPIAQGEPILASNLFKRDDPGFMSGLLDKGMRAVTLAVTPITGAGGFILPGDHVDILLSHDKAKEALRKTRPKGKDAKAAPRTLAVLSTTTETILTNIQIVAVDQTVGKIEGQAAPAKNVTMQVTPKQAELITTARAMGKLSLVLRSIGPDTAEKKSNSYTTDVEVSPFLSAIQSGLNAEELERRKKLTTRIEELEKASKTKGGELEALKKKKQELEAEKGQNLVKAAPAKAKKKKATVKIYRGGGAKTEEVEVK